MTLSSLYRTNNLVLLNNLETPSRPEEPKLISSIRANETHLNELVIHGEKGTIINSFF